MNIIVANKYKDLILSTNIEIMKEMDGVFSVSDIFNSLQSIFYKKIVIDATAIANFPKEEVLRELASKFDLDKLILLLPPDSPPPRNFLSFLVSLNIFNFTDNPRGLYELLRKSNTHEDVKDFVVLKEEVNEPMPSDVSFDPGVKPERVVLGIFNVTNDSYSTELIYMLKKNLEEVHKKQVVAVEVDKNNFSFYNTSNMHSVNGVNLKEFLTYQQGNDIILIDLFQNEQYVSFCNDVLYIIDPSIYRINQLVLNDRNAFAKLQGKKVILVNSLLKENDINTFAKEAGISVYFNLPPLNDRIYNPVLDRLLLKLGLIEQQTTKPKKGLFDLFK